MHNESVDLNSVFFFLHHVEYIVAILNKKVHFFIVLLDLLGFFLVSKASF